MTYYRGKEKLKKEPEPQEVPPATEVDYLKKIRSHMKRTSLLIGIGLMLLEMLLLLYRYFYVGSEANAMEVILYLSE